MASSSPSHHDVVFLLFLIFACSSAAANNSSSANAMTINTNTAHIKAIKSLCKSTPHPNTCFDSLKLTISININPSIITFALQSLHTAISEATKLSSLFPATGGGSSPYGGIVEKQKSTIQDCKDLHQITISSLQKSASIFQNPSAAGKKISDVNAYLSAALTNKNTCLQGLNTASGPLKPALVQSVTEAYKHVGNSLSIVSRSSPPPKSSSSAAKAPLRHNRRLLGGFPVWMSRRDRRLLQSNYGDDNGDDPQGLVLMVALDGSGNFTRVSDAVAFAPSNNDERTFIVVRAGVYEENVEIPMDKTNIVLLGDGRDVTVIRGRRSAADGWTSYRSATVGVSGQGFLARGITFENTAGAANGQAVALRINADLAAVYRCTINGYQDTLYVHSFRQFFRECDISGTVDFIFGNAAVVFQQCNLFARVPVHGQANVITAQGRDDPNEDTGISIQRCSIIASNELAASPGSAKTYLGRPWQIYSTTVYMESFLDGLVDPAGWLNWIGDQGLDTLYYGEYENTGPGSGTNNRVDWPGYHLMSYDDAVDFTVSEFIDGDEWLDSTSFPYDDGV